MLKSLQNDIKGSYNSLSNDIPREFYNPILAKSKEYKRVSGYFSSKALSLYSEGLDRLAENNGKMKLIISQDISQGDYNQIKEGYRLRSQDERLTDVDKKRLGNLAFLIASNRADIKFGFVNNGLFHTKWGLFEDERGDKVYFNGSLNETARGIENNYDSFDVDFSWDTSVNVRERITQKTTEFDILWNNLHDVIKVKNANDVIYELIGNYNIGKIQKNYTLESNMVLFDMDADNFYLIDKTNEETIGKKSFKNKLIYYVDDEKGYPYFRGDFDYKTVEKIIDNAQKQTIKNGYEFIITPEVKRFINSQRYSINEYRKSGLTLKEMDLAIWGEEFREFSEIVSDEVVRPMKKAQLQAAMYMLTQKRAANFSVPGSGKTAMVLSIFAYLNSIKKKTPIKRILVICPINAFMSWIDEFKFVFGSKKQLKQLSVHDEKVNGNIYAFETFWVDSNLVLVNYESLNKFQDSIIKCLETTKDTMIVYDEVHRVKGIESKRAISALEIADKADYRYVLTGTPIPNSYLDIYNFLNILYKNEYNSYFGFDYKLLNNPDQYEIEEINEKLKPYYWRTSKEDLGVPKAEADHIIEVRPSQEQERLSQIIYTKTENSLAVWIRMIQLSTNPELINQVINYNDLGYSDADTFEDESYDQMGERFRKELEESIHNASIGEVKDWDLSKIESPKFTRGIDLVLELVREGKKVVVWGLFVDTLKKITKSLEKHGIKVGLIYGGTPKEERENMINTFKESNESITVLVSNPNTLGESVSLHTVAHDAVYFEYNYNLTFMLQSRDRIHRLGLKKDDKTNYYYLMTVSDKEMFNFIDQKIYTRLNEKSERMIAAIDGEFLIPEFEDDEIEEMKRIIYSERGY